MQPIDPKRIRKILLARPEMLGDTILLTPLVSALKHQFPLAQIFLLIKSGTEAVAINNPEINGVLTQKEPLQGGAFFSMLSQVKKERFDVSIVLEDMPRPELALMMFMARIPYRLGDRNRLLYAWTYNRGIRLETNDDHSHQVELFGKLLAPLGIKRINFPLRLFPAESAIAKVRQLLNSHGITGHKIVMHLGTGGGNRALLPSTYAQIANLIWKELGTKPILLGGKRELATYKQMQKELTVPSLPLIDQLTLPEMFALLKLGDAFIGVDTGPLHAAAALGVPIAAIYPAKDVRNYRWYPWMTKHLRLEVPAESCGLKCNHRNCQEDLCLRAVDPNTVLEMVKTLLINPPHAVLSDGAALNILLIRPDAMGDALLITPAISLIRKSYPLSRITVLANSYTAPIFKNNPEVDEVLLDPFYQKKAKLAEIFTFGSELKKHNFDASVHFYNEFPYAFAAKLAGIALRAGDRSKPLLSWLYTDLVSQRWNDLACHEVENNCLLLSPLEIQPSDLPPMAITPSESAIKKAQEITQKYNLEPSRVTAVVHLGSGKGNKPYLAEYFAEVVNHLISKHQAKVILIGTAKEQEAGKTVERLANHPVINLIGKTTLDELIGIITLGNLYLGVDTGPMHLAAALQIPTVAIFATKFVKPSRWGPWKTLNRIVRHPVACSRVCLPAACPLDDCLREMKPEMVIEAAETLLAGKSQTPADWFKLSLNVLTDSSELKEMLSLEGVNARQATDFSISGLVSQLKAQETNVIHLVSGRKRLNFVLARLLATLVLPMPPVFIIGKPEMTIELILAKYKARFRDRKYL